MGRPSISEQRRIEIGRALQVCMIKNGSYESTSVKDIAQQAGIATGLVHHYFASKDEILLLMADISLLSITNFLDDLLHIKDQAQRQAKIHELLSNQEQSQFLLMLHTLALSMPAIKALIVKNSQELQDSLAGRLRRRRSFEGDPEQMALEVVFLLQSAMFQCALEPMPCLEPILQRTLERILPLSSQN